MGGGPRRVRTGLLTDSSLGDVYVTPLETGTLTAPLQWRPVSGEATALQERGGRRVFVFFVLGDVGTLCLMGHKHMVGR